MTTQPRRDLGPWLMRELELSHRVLRFIDKRIQEQHRWKFKNNFVKETPQGRKL